MYWFTEDGLGSYYFDHFSIYIIHKSELTRNYGDATDDRSHFVRGAVSLSIVRMAFIGMCTYVFSAQFEDSVYAVTKRSRS